MLQDTCYRTHVTENTLQVTRYSTFATGNTLQDPLYQTEATKHIGQDTRDRSNTTTIHRNKIFIDKNGNMKVPMVAAWDIEEGEELEWDYDYLAGIIG